jgi:hypothetical protein
VDEGGGGVDAGLEPQQARPAAHFSGLVEIARQNFLLDAGRIAGRRVPAFVHVDGVKFEMWLVHWHLTPGIIGLFRPLHTSLRTLTAGNLRSSLVDNGQHRFRAGVSNVAVSAPVVEALSHANDTTLDVAFVPRQSTGPKGFACLTRPDRSRT